MYINVLQAFLIINLFWTKVESFNIQAQCTTPEGNQGICTPIYHCQSIRSYIEANSGINNSTAVNYCYSKNRSERLVCCPKTRIKRYASRSHSSSCGITGSKYLSKVVNGNPAKLGAWPWIAVLGFRKSGGRMHWGCGGSLITDRHVLTAGHCIRNHKSELHLVRLGELDLNNHNKGAHPVDYRISRMTVHKNYHPDSHENDVGMLKLASKVKFTRYIKPICLPTSSMRRETFVKKSPFIAGWGATSSDGPSASHLQQAQVPVVSTSVCKRNYADKKPFLIDSKVICAGYARGGTDTCQGDSGGPLMYPVSSRGSLKYYLIGITSFGYECARAGYPGVYMRVGSFMPWIESQIRN